jgi:hypothetical protein
MMALSDFEGHTSAEHRVAYITFLLAPGMDGLQPLRIDTDVFKRSAILLFNDHDNPPAVYFHGPHP